MVSKTEKVVNMRTRFSTRFWAMQDEFLRTTRGRVGKTSYCKWSNQRLRTYGY